MHYSVLGCDPRNDVTQTLLFRQSPIAITLGLKSADLGPK